MAVRNKNIPALRFKEFNGNWNKKELGDICTFYSGGTPSSTNKKLYSGNIPFIGSGNIYDSEVSSFITEEALNSSSAKMVKEGDLLYALYGANSGEVAISKISGAINQAILCIRSDMELIQFLFALLLFNKDKIVTKYLQGGQGNLSANIIKRLRFYFPSLPEQQKIASFLSAIDEKIRQLTRRKELLEQYKKGLMQQLFSGNLRFKDDKGKAYPKWEEKKIGSVLEIGSGRDYKHLGSGVIPVFGTGGYMLSVNEKLYSGETVFIGRKGTIDKPIYFNGDFWTVDTLFYTHKFIGVLPKFIYIVFQQVNWKLHNEASGVPSLSKATIEKIKIKIPLLEEQKRIVDFIFSIDSKIESVTAQIEGTKGYKKGLLQQMFV